MHQAPSDFDTENAPRSNRGSRDSPTRGRVREVRRPLERKPRGSNREFFFEIRRDPFDDAPLAFHFRENLNGTGKILPRENSRKLDKRMNARPGTSNLSPRLARPRMSRDAFAPFDRGLLEIGGAGRYISKSI